MLNNLVKAAMALVAIALIIAIAAVFGYAILWLGFESYPSIQTTTPAEVFGAYLIRVGLLVMLVSAGIALATQVLGLFVSAKSGTSGEITISSTGYKDLLGVAKDLAVVPGGIGFLILGVGAILLFGAALSPA